MEEDSPSQEVAEGDTEMGNGEISEHHSSSSDSSAGESSSSEAEVNPPPPKRYRHTARGHLEGRFDPQDLKTGALQRLCGGRREM